MNENFITQLKHSSYYDAMNSQNCSFSVGGSGMNGDERNGTEWRSVELPEIWRIVHDLEAKKLLEEENSRRVDVDGEVIMHCCVEGEVRKKFVKNLRLNLKF